MASSNTIVKGKKKKQNRVLFWAPECKYSVIFDRVKEIGWRLVDDEKSESKVNLFWIDVATIHERFRSIQPWQCINHFPGMPNIARKNRMGQNLNKMLKIFPKEYAFYPRTWILPSEMSDFRLNFDSSGNSIGNKVYIIKPDAGCQGRGIFLTRTFDTVPTQESVVAQLYIKKPMLLDGFKFDLRLYCFVASVKPLRIYLFHDGLVRMCTEEYVKPTKQNIHMVCMHLTNYAVNKHNENFQQPSAKSSEELDSQEEGHKRSLLWFMNKVRTEHGDTKADWLWRRMGILCTRTIMSILPTLSREYDQHFKSFRSIPMDIKKLLIPLPGNGAAVGSTSSKLKGGGVVACGSERRSATAAAATSEEDPSDDEDDEDGNVVVGNSNSGKKTTGSVSTDGGEGGESENTNDDQVGGGGGDVLVDDQGNRLPKMRGSRSFEILGFDIMIDSNLKPWLIEVNHLPR
jgi:tubulin polyglutamylase TTLL6/13